MNIYKKSTSGLKFRVLAVIILFAGVTWGEESVLKDIAYDSKDPAQKIDVYLAKSEKPAPAMIFIHGGGWHAGSKKGVPGFLRKANAEGWLAVVSVEYRFTQVAIHPAQVQDCTRAIQFVKLNAKKWNIDPERIGVTGGSAGGHLTAYMGTQDDKANPSSDDPVEQESSKVLFTIPFAGPTDWKLLSSIKHGHPGYLQLIGYKPGTPVNELSAKLIKDVSPVSFVSKDDPPMLIIHGDADTVVPFEHARSLEKAMKKAGVPVELYVVKGGTHSVAGAGGEGAVQADAYMRKKLQ